MPVRIENVAEFRDLCPVAPVLHPRFEKLASLDEVDKAICAWRDKTLEVKITDRTAGKPSEL